MKWRQNLEDELLFPVNNAKAGKASFRLLMTISDRDELREFLVSVAGPSSQTGLSSFSHVSAGKEMYGGRYEFTLV